MKQGDTKDDFDTSNECHYPVRMGGEEDCFFLEDFGFGLMKVFPPTRDI